MSGGSVVQLVGFLLVTAALASVWGPWMLFGAGVMLIVVPEVVEVLRRDPAAQPPAVEPER